jgi:hypothetical protein
MRSFKPGDRITIAQRECNAEDAKTGLYYGYFGGLTGTVDRVYQEGSVCVIVDLDSLPAGMRDRHLKVQKQERDRWLHGLSDEVRNRLTGEQKQLKMSYNILVGAADLAPLVEVKAVKPVETLEPEPETEDDAPPPHRLTEAELEAQEEQFLKLKQEGGE